MIETPHTNAECQILVDQVYAMGYIHHFDWGCKAGVHCGWAVIEAEDEKLAELAVPPLVRHKARITKLTKGEPSAMKPLHSVKTNRGKTS
jgi:hypothetical protein